MQPSYTVRIPCQPCSILNAARDTGDAASGLHGIQPLPLLWAQSAGGALHLDTGEYGHPLPHHVWCDRDRAPADQISAANRQAELNRPAMLVTQRAGVVAVQAHRTPAEGQPYLLLNALLRQSCSTAGGSVRAPHCSAMAAAMPWYVRLRAFHRSGPGGM